MSDPQRHGSPAHDGVPITLPVAHRRLRRSNALPLAHVWKNVALGHPGPRGSRDGLSALIATIDAEATAGQPHRH